MYQNYISYHVILLYTLVTSTTFCMLHIAFMIATSQYKTICRQPSFNYVSKLLLLSRHYVIYFSYLNHFLHASYSLYDCKPTYPIIKEWKLATPTIKWYLYKNQWWYGKFEFECFHIVNCNYIHRVHILISLMKY